jgi:asparagine synthase (glutamine-hydrolysing)
MCGIAGIFNLNDQPVQEVELAAMTERLIHRGPDGLGYYIDGPVGLGQTRLAVIDIEGGKQPIFNEDKSVVTVFNGEIYNFKEIKKALEKAGHIFSTNSDTEVIVHQYETEGGDCARRFRGMFVFALWDQKRKRLLLARDIVGKKPLYYSLGKNRLVFGSEIKALLAIGGGGSFNYPALDLFFKYQFIPEPETIYRDIRILPPAHSLIVDAKGVEIKRFWKAPFPSQESVPEEVHVESLRQALDEAVQLRLISDVPLGAFLSGGIDSSIIVGLMKKRGSSRIKTFSIGFKEESFDESAYAKQVAHFFQTDHQDGRLEYQIEDLLPELIDHFDQPFGDSSALAVYKLSEMTRRFVTVALSGDGSDEIFAGYRRYVGRKLLSYYWLLPRWLREKGVESVLSLFPEPTRYYGDSLIRQLHLLTASSRRLEGNPLELLPVTFNQEERARLYSDPMKAELKSSQKDPIHLWAERFSNLDEISQMMWVDFNTYLPGDILVKVDRMSMAHGLEVRSPFLDQKVIECVMRMPIDLKLKNWETKSILKKAFQDLLPVGVTQRRKHGFMVPLGDWFKTGLRGFVHDVLLKSDRHGLLNLAYIEQLFYEHQRGFRDHSQKLWLLLVFRLWEERCA